LLDWYKENTIIAIWKILIGVSHIDRGTVRTTYTRMTNPMVNLTTNARS
jgi:hypothetical protein